MVSDILIILGIILNILSLHPMAILDIIPYDIFIFNLLGLVMIMVGLIIGNWDIFDDNK